MYYQDNNVGTVYGNSCSPSENSYEKVRTIKLRIQNEMSIPANCVTVYSRNGDERNPQTDNNINKDDDKVNYNFYIDIK